MTAWLHLGNKFHFCAWPIWAEVTTYLGNDKVVYSLYTDIYISACQILHAIKSTKDLNKAPKYTSSYFIVVKVSSVHNLSFDIICLSSFTLWNNVPELLPVAKHALNFARNKTILLSCGTWGLLGELLFPEANLTAPCNNVWDRYSLYIDTWDWMYSGIPCYIRSLVV